MDVECVCLCGEVSAGIVSMRDKLRVNEIRAWRVYPYRPPKTTFVKLNANLEEWKDPEGQGPSNNEDIVPSYVLSTQ